MTTDRPLAWVEGQLVPREEARLSIDDFGFRYGAACFETMLARHGVVFRLERHLDRLESGLQLLGVTPPSRVALGAAIRQTLEANGLEDASVRLTVTAGVGHAPDLAGAVRPAVVVTVDPLPPRPSPARLEVVSVRLDEGRPWRVAKVAQFLPYLLARQEAQARGADDALLLNHRGHLAEAATSNLFLLTDTALVTPSLASGPLPGVTREAVLEIARAEGISVSEGEYEIDVLMAANGAFLSASLGLRVIQSISARPDVAGVGVDWVSSEPDHPVFRRLLAGYEALVERECGGTGP